MQRVPFDIIGMTGNSKRYAESAAAWAQFMLREGVPAFAGMTWEGAVMTVVGAGMAWVWAGTECSRTNRERRCLARAGGHEFSLWFVGLCRIVSISVDGGRGAVLRELGAAGGIPAYAGMTWEGAVMAWEGVVMAWVGVVMRRAGGQCGWGFVCFAHGGVSLGCGFDGSS